MAVGRIANSGSIFTPDAELIGGELAQAPLRDMATDRMREFLRASVLELLGPLKALKTLIEGAGGNKTPWIPFAGVTSIPNTGELASSGFTPQALSLAGYRAVGNRIIRFDILNRLSFIIREAQDQFKKTKTPEAKGHKFQIMAEMLALLGSTYEDVRGVLTALGYKSETAETALTLEETAPVAAEPSAVAPAPAAAAAAIADTPKTDTPAAAIAEASAATAAPPASPAAPAPATPAAASAPKPKPKPKKSLSLYHHRETDDAGVTTEIQNLEYWHFPTRGQKGFKPGGRGKPAFKGKRDKSNFKGPKPRRDAPKGNRPPTQKQVENSPFAALAALKNPKKD